MDTVVIEMLAIFQAVTVHPDQMMLFKCPK